MGLQGLERQQDPHGEVAKNFRVKGFKGTVSFVTSMTQAFCADCNRLRLMADGNLKVLGPCLQAHARWTPLACGCRCLAPMRGLVISSRRAALRPRAASADKDHLFTSGLIICSELGRDLES